MWDSLWFNANLITCAAKQMDYGFIADAAIAVKKGKISWLGPVSNLKQPYDNLATQVYDMKQRFITPGLIDCHTHLVYGGNRAKDFSLRLQGLNYQAIAAQDGGILTTVSATQQATFQELYDQSHQRLQQMLRQGTTTVEIKSGYGLTPAAELKQLEVIQQLANDHPISIYPTFLAAHAIPKKYKTCIDDYIDLICQQTLPKVIDKKLAYAIDAFCESIAFTPAQIAKIFQLAQQANLKIKLHAEQLSQNGGCQLAARYHAISADHLEHATESDIAALSASKTTAVLLPGAFYFLNETKKPPLHLLRQYQVPIALATDCNPGTSPITSLTLIMNMAAILWGLTPVETLRATTINAAKALDIAEHYGSLEVNKMADFAIWDIQHPEELSYYIGSLSPTMVIKHGKLIIQ